MSVKDGGTLEFIKTSTRQTDRGSGQAYSLGVRSDRAGRGNRGNISHWGLIDINDNYWPFPSLCHETCKPETTNHITQSLCMALQERQLEGLNQEL